MEFYSWRETDSFFFKQKTAYEIPLRLVGSEMCIRDRLHGGWGYMWEYPVCRAFADSRVQRIYGGSNEIMKLIISRDLMN